MTMQAGTPSQTIGPFFHFALDQPEWSDLTRNTPPGERIVIEGQVLDGDRAPVEDALLEIWQANAEGKYDHPEDAQADKRVDSRFRGFGRALTDAQGRYQFTTLRPGRVPGRDGALLAPHINVAIFARGLLKQLVTRIYLGGEPANETDPVLTGIADATARRTLLAVRHDAGAGRPATYRFDIVLQGAGETVFFDI
jgi:protocatechuate 3,4-dioxygenase alpha subunit